MSEEYIHIWFDGKEYYGTKEISTKMGWYNEETFRQSEEQVRKSIAFMEEHQRNERRLADIEEQRLLRNY